MALVEGFSHLVIQVTNLDRSETFYQEVLGLARGLRSCFRGEAQLATENEHGPDGPLGSGAQGGTLPSQ